MTAFFGVSVVSVIGDTIVANIESNISEKAPALYLVDITTSQLPKVREIAGSSFQEYPIIR